MRVVVSALVILAVAMIIGCDNDENTVDPIPKFHITYPIIHLKVDNGYRDFGVESLLVTVDPDVGWLEPVYTDFRGFFGALAAGTFITDLDTVYNDGDSVEVETTSVVFGFNPSQTYTFEFSSAEPFLWRDSFLAVYATTIDSEWIRFSADTVYTTPRIDPERPIDTVLYRVVENPSPTATPPPDELIDQPLLYGWWFDSAFVVTDSEGTAEFPPDSFTYDTIKWGYWHRVDTFFLEPESALWCDVIETRIVEETLRDVYNNPMYVIDTVYVYGNCEPVIDSVRRRIYNNWDWGSIANNGDPLTSYEQTIHFTYPDTLKALEVTPQGLTIYALEVSPDSLDTAFVDTSQVDIHFIDESTGDTTMINDLLIELTMPPVEVFPAYKVLIRESDQ